MSKIVLIHNASTNEVSELEMTDEEYESYLESQLDSTN